MTFEEWNRAVPTSLFEQTRQERSALSWEASQNNRDAELWEILKPIRNWYEDEETDEPMDLKEMLRALVADALVDRRDVLKLRAHLEACIIKLNEEP